jgi:hypothetical protein
VLYPSYQELEERAKFLDALVEKYNVKKPSDAPITQLPPLPEDEAIRCIQVSKLKQIARTLFNVF